MFKKFLLFTFIFLLFAELNSLLANQQIYESKCGKCHSLRNPNNYTKKDWKYNVERMAKRAGLTEEEIKSIIALNTK
ncbi:MAG TPA: hypothetical protein PKX79_03330 [Spirochaetota bacterium]|nr:hypothetical protein [Spirochaetota bacterium]HPP94398.1 hypothetical protein [Spirochaetota bacterium]